MVAVARDLASDVFAFYKELPFNFRESVQSSAEAIRSQDPRSAYPVLQPLLTPTTRVLDVGCGAGWFANAVSHHCGCAVTGIDFNPVAVDRAAAVANLLRLNSRFEVADLFTYEPNEPYDLVVSLGVLHHTSDCKAAVQRVCERLVKPGGHVFIGLYHKYGRQPFLDHFAAMRERGATEEEMLERYKQLHSHLDDDVLLKSWFRDQVLHPHETQHTLEEIIPVVQKSGMELVSTSINRFRPITSLRHLYSEEHKYRAIGEQRLRDNRYFTGFFVFLLRKSESEVLDDKPYIEHDPQLGYRYVANADMTLRRPGGGTYRFETNSRGIRSAREYDSKKPPGIFRIIVCGDSMSAGQFVSNEHRLSEQLERRVPGLEVINLSLEGTGTDQQLLLYESDGLRYEHDLVVLMPFLSNLRRNMVAAREGIDPITRARVVRGKPRFELVDGRLELRNVPVPRDVAATGITVEISKEARSTIFSIPRERLNAIPGVSLFKRLIYSFAAWEPFPEFRNASSPEWRMMEAIVRRFKECAGHRPLIIVPTVYDSYVRYRMARNYWARFSELERIPGVRVIDLLPQFRNLGREAERAFQAPHDMHFSSFGHLVVAEILATELARYLPPVRA